MSRRIIIGTNRIKPTGTACKLKIIREPNLDGNWQKRYMPNCKYVDSYSYEYLDGIVDSNGAHISVMYSYELSGQDGAHYTVFVPDNHCNKKLINHIKSVLKDRFDVTGTTFIRFKLKYGRI